MDTRAFLLLLFGPCHGWLEIRLVPEGPGRVESRFFPLPDGIAASAAFALGASGHRHVFFGAELRAERGSGAEAVQEAGCLFADLDADDFPGGAAEIDRRLAAFLPLPHDDRRLRGRPARLLGPGEAAARASPSAAAAAGGALGPGRWPRPAAGAHPRPARGAVPPRAGNAERQA